MNEGSRVAILLGQAVVIGQDNMDIYIELLKNLHLAQRPCRAARSLNELQNPH